jgi:hypothetical protein
MQHYLPTTMPREADLPKIYLPGSANSTRALLEGLVADGAQRSWFEEHLVELAPYPAADRASLAAALENRAAELRTMLLQRIERSRADSEEASALLGLYLIVADGSDPEALKPLRRYAGGKLQEHVLGCLLEMNTRASRGELFLLASSRQPSADKAAETLLVSLIGKTPITDENFSKHSNPSVSEDERLEAARRVVNLMMKGSIPAKQRPTAVLLLRSYTGEDFGNNWRRWDQHIRKLTHGEQAEGDDPEKDPPSEETPDRPKDESR